MDLEVDPRALADTAARVSQLTPALHAALPAGWMAPAGADAGSAAAARYFNGQAEAAYNAYARVLDAVSDHAHRVGAAAADYTGADADGGRLLGDGGGQALSNPVAVPHTHAGRVAPTASVVLSAAVDPLTFAQQLYSGPGPGPARAYAGSIREFLSGAHASSIEGLDAAASELATWTPVGTMAAAALTGHRNALDALGSGLSAIADGVDAYADAFHTAKHRHPTPQEILDLRKRLLAAIRTKDPTSVELLEEFERQNGISAQTGTDYAAEISNAAATTDAKTSTSAAAAATPATGGNTGNSGAGGNSSDSTMLTSMLPTLLSSLTGANGLLSQHNTTGDDSAGLGDDELTGDGYQPLPSIPTFDGGSGGAPSVPSLAPDSPGDLEPAGLPVGRLPSTGTPSQLAGLPRTPVIDQVSNSTAAAANPRAGTSPYPYMPMSPGMGGAGAGAGGGDRSRVVAWHPDRLMYVDDTPHTEAVIGEKPSIAPSITPATPAQTPTPTGGTV